MEKLLKGMEKEVDVVVKDTWVDLTAPHTEGMILNYLRLKGVQGVTCLLFEGLVVGPASPPPLFQLHDCPGIGSLKDIGAISQTGDINVWSSTVYNQSFWGFGFSYSCPCNSASGTSTDTSAAPTSTPRTSNPSASCAPAAPNTTFPRPHSDPLSMSIIPSAPPTSMIPSQPASTAPSMWKTWGRLRQTANKEDGEGSRLGVKSTPGAVNALPDSSAATHKRVHPDAQGSPYHILKVNIKPKHVVQSLQVDIAGYGSLNINDDLERFKEKSGIYELTGTRAWMAIQMMFAQTTRPRLPCDVKSHMIWKVY
ncbi:hypothetical protein DFH29DRAFT_1010022 [Suillus ampliporus]|nr:hypothetical protein DFH29DRAFT_1010022 [Suillus ampliporus]